jgi:fungal nitric oxide reductase
VLYCVLLYVLLKQGVITFLEHADQLKEMLNDDSLINSAVEELLRFHTASALATKRVALEDVTISGVVSTIH